jgi:hypothetical protein
MARMLPNTQRLSPWWTTVRSGARGRCRGRDGFDAASQRTPRRCHGAQAPPYGSTVPTPPRVLTVAWAALGAVQGFSTVATGSRARGGFDASGVIKSVMSPV